MPEVDTRPKACVVRYGAIGDMIMVTPLLERLHYDGYHVTVNCAPYNASVLENNPYVDNVIIQDRDAIPNPELQMYHEYWASRYDKYVNLCESIEGSLLRLEMRGEFFVPQVVRSQECNKNYIEETLRIGGYESGGNMQT